MLRKSILRVLTLGVITYAALQYGSTHEYKPTTKLFHQVGAALLFIIWLIYLLRSGKTLPSTRLDRPIWALTIGWIAAGIFAYDPRVSLEFVWPILLNLLIFYLFVYMLQNGMQHWVIEGLILSASVVVLITVREMIDWYFEPSSSSPFINGWPHWFGLSIPPVIHPAGHAFDHKNPLGAFCLLLIPVLVAWADTVHNRLQGWILRILTGSLIAVLLLSQSRGAYMGFATMLGLMLLITLLHERRYFHPAIRRLLAPPFLIIGTILASLLAFAAIFWLTIRSSNPDDVARIDLWYSAIQIFKDHPLIGIGPHQFATVRPWYYHWVYSPSYASLWHAHNLPLNILAEGGVILFTLSTWVLVRFGHIWIDAWKVSSPARQRRLEGILIALAAFGVHSLVDVFTRTQTTLLVIAMVAYVVNSTNQQPTQPQTKFQRRAPILALLTLLIVAQIAFVPVHWGALAQQRAIKALAANEPEKALREVRTAEKADPSFTLYRQQEATILGILANEDPEKYLDRAIRVYESGLDRYSAWSIGWHNLAALYAQAGRYQDAVQAELTAIRWDQTPGGYHLKLGEYYEALGQPEQARDAYFEALRWQPSLASSGFWTDPEHPERAAILPAAIDHFAALDKTALALDIAVYSDNRDAVLRLADQVDRHNAPSLVRLRLDALWPDGATEPCRVCYVLTILNDEPVRYYMLWSERLMLGYGPAPADLTPEKAAHAAIFLSDHRSAWGWYVLARLAEDAGADNNKVNDLLARSVQLPYDYRSGYAVVIYGTVGRLDVLPQARTPILSSLIYEPWLTLAERYELSGEWDKAREVYENILLLDPYAWNIKAHLDTLPSSTSTADLPPPPG